jgi:RNA polymerase sigma-B factor
MEDPTASDWNLEDRLTIADAIARLPERQQQILHLRFDQDMTQSEIAEILDISQMHVSRLLSAATDTLRTHLAEPDL